MNREIKSAKSRYYCDLISETKGDLNKLWKAVNADGAHHTNPWSIYSALNSHFVSIGRILPEKISCIARASLPVNDHSRLFQSQEISESVAHKQLPALKANKAIGLDNVHARLLKCSAQSITYSITKLINLSLRTGKFQGILKCFKVTALLKSGDRTNQTNYRPISILPTLSKILERVIHCQLYEYLDSNNLNK